MFDEASDVPVADRGEWLSNACGGDERLRAEVEHLLAADRQANRNGFLDHPELASRGDESTGTWPPTGGRLPVVEAGLSRHLRTGPVEGTDCFSPKAAITSGRRQRSQEETRAVIQSRLRELPLIYVPIFAMMLLLRPIVLNSLSMAILAPFGMVATTFAGITIFLSARRVSLPWLWRIELIMTVMLAALLVVVESHAISGPFVPVDRIRAEKIVKNVVLLVSLVMLIDAIYVPKGWRRAAIVSSLLAMLPMAAVAGAYLLRPESVRWVGEAREDGNKPLAVFGMDTMFLLTLAAISSYGAHTISRLRSQVVERVGSASTVSASRSGRAEWVRSTWRSTSC